MTRDIFTLEVFKNQVVSVAEEMGAALHRTAFSPNIKERKDHSCAVFDPEGRLVAQAEHIPVHLGAMPETVGAVLENMELEPGDLVVLNDPFLGGTHLPDISMVSPVFQGNRLVALLASRAHHSDVGGITPGSLGLSGELFQEGLIIPPIKLVKGGKYDREAESFILANVRNPEERSGDLQAQAGAHSLGEKRILELSHRYPWGAFEKKCLDLMEYSEERTRLALLSIPDGKYSYRDFLDDDGFSDQPVALAVTILIEGDTALVDFQGTSPAVKGPLNCPEAVTKSATYYVFRCVTGEDIPANHGAFRPISVSIPPGSLLAARRPFAVAGGNVETSQRIVDVLLGALSRALPEMIPAASYGTMSNLAIGSVPGGFPVPFSYYETIAGGTGGHPLGRGANGTHAHMTNTLNTPVEALEYAYPLRVKRYSIRRRSGGSGFKRGGDGLIREIQTLCECTVTVLSDRRSAGPWGLRGGFPGKPGSNLLVTADGCTRKLPSKCVFSTRPGDRIIIKTPGGGGWGRRPL